MFGHPGFHGRHDRQERRGCHGGRGEGRGGLTGRQDAARSMPRTTEADRLFWSDQAGAEKDAAAAGNNTAPSLVSPQPTPMRAAAADDADIQAAVCPLCENHCPLNAPSCGKGRAYARTAQGASHE